METAMAAGLLMHPIALLIGAAIVVASAFAIYHFIPRAKSIPPLRLLGGYVGAVIACAAIAVWSVYIPIEEAQSVWKVPPDQYWLVLRKEFIVLFVVMAYTSLIGIAVVGAPIIYALHARQRACVPWVLLASVVMSVIASVLLVVSFQSSATFANTAPLLVATHPLLALGFSLGARLPWRFREISA